MFQLKPLSRTVSWQQQVNYKSKTTIKSVFLFSSSLTRFVSVVTLWYMVDLVVAWLLIYYSRVGKWRWLILLLQGHWFMLVVFASPARFHGLPTGLLGFGFLIHKPFFCDSKRLDCFLSYTMDVVLFLKYNFCLVSNLPVCHLWFLLCPFKRRGSNPPIGHVSFDVEVLQVSLPFRATNV